MIAKVNRFPKWFVQNLRRYVPVTLYLTQAQMKKEFAGTFGGFLWWLADPVFYCFIYYFVFAVVFHTKTVHFVSFLLISLSVWRWFSATIMQGMTALTANAALMRQIDIPKVVFPIRVILVEMVKFFVGLTIIVTLLVITGHISTGTAWMFPVVFFPVFFMLTGIVLILSGLTTFVPDLRHMVRLGFRALMFMSGVFFEASHVPERYRFYFYLNPLATALEQFRGILLYGREPSPTALAAITMLAVVLCSTGLWMHWKYNRVFPRFLD